MAYFTMNLKEELEARGFLNQYTSEELFDIYNTGGQTLYFGCDPTANSLHLGNFVVFMNAVNFMKRNNKLIMIVGGATGMIGDPGGKDSERTFLDEITLANNIAAIENQVRQILQNLTKLSGQDFEFVVMNNADFYKDMGYLTFLREVGKYITVNQMMSKETVKKRIEDPDKSISYTEFSYMLLQGYDFLRLYQKNGCKLQISGSDQWGNIVTGVELIRKKLDEEAFGMTSPLIVDSTGRKFGKSEGNAMFLDKAMTAPFKIYQYFMNSADEDVAKYFKLFTLLSLDDINAIVEKHSEKPEDRFGQKQLASYIVQTLHGAEAAESATKASEFLFGTGDKIDQLANLTQDDIDTIATETGSISYKMDMTVIDALVESGLESSRGNAKKSIEAGAVYLNEEEITDIAQTINSAVSFNGWQILRKGKKNFVLVRM